DGGLRRSSRRAWRRRRAAFGCHVGCSGGGAGRHHVVATFLVREVVRLGVDAELVGAGLGVDRAVGVGGRRRRRIGRVCARGGVAAGGDQDRGGGEHGGEGGGATVIHASRTHVTVARFPSSSPATADPDPPAWSGGRRAAL